MNSASEREVLSFAWFMNGSESSKLCPGFLTKLGFQEAVPFISKKIQIPLLIWVPVENIWGNLVFIEQNFLGDKIQNLFWLLSFLGDLNATGWFLKRPHIHWPGLPLLAVCMRISECPVPWGFLSLSSLFALLFCGDVNARSLTVREMAYSGSRPR